MWTSRSRQVLARTRLQRENEKANKQVTPERWQEVKNVLAAVLERTPGERTASLEETCADSDVRREVES
jgi:hypothetical protein